MDVDIKITVNITITVNIKITCNVRQYSLVSVLVSSRLSEYENQFLRCVAKIIISKTRMISVSDGLE